MGETFCQTGGVHMAMDIVRNQINIDREFLFQANPSTAQGCPSVLLDWQIKSHLDARIGKKRASAFNGVGHQPATTLWSLRKPGSDAQDMVSATMLRFLMIKATATSSPPATLRPDA